MEAAAFMVISGTAAAVGVFLGIRMARRTGLKTDMSPALRGSITVFIAATLGIGLFAAWEITHGHSAIGIGVLIAFYLVPNVVLIPVRIRQANQRAPAGSPPARGSAR